jgi:hypothetical protein
LRGSLIISVILHTALIGTALIGFTSHKPPVSAPPPVAVSVVTPSDMTSVKAGKADARPEEAAKQAPSAEKKPELVSTPAKLPVSEKPSEKVAALPPPKPKTAPPEESTAKPEKEEKREPERPVERQAEKSPAPPPLPKHAEQPKPQRREPPREEAQPAREDKPKPRQAEPKPRPQRQDKIAELIDKPTMQAQGKSDFDPERIAALLNRDPTAGGAPMNDEPREPWRKPSTLEDQATGMAPDQPDRFARGSPEGRDQRMSANEIDAFRAQISRCWTPPVGGLGGDPIVVKLRIALKEDGSLVRPPEVSNQMGSPFFRPAADSAVRAVMQCQPYQMPSEKYGQWRDMLLTFDPRHMYGG